MLATNRWRWCGPNGVDLFGRGILILLPEGKFREPRTDRLSLSQYMYVLGDVLS
jgi:hypothetical protein